MSRSGSLREESLINILFIVDGIVEPFHSPTTFLFLVNLRSSESNFRQDHLKRNIK